MDNAQSFLESILSTSHRCMGYRLRPVTLFHLTLLDRYCPGVLGSLFSKSDLALAAMICSCRDDADLHRPWLNSVRARLCGLWNFNKERAAWAAYISDNLNLAETMKDTKVAEKDSPFPYTLSFAASLISQTGWAWHEVFYKMNVSHIHWLTAALGYIESGKTSVISDKERKIFAVLKEQKAELAGRN